MDPLDRVRATIRRHDLIRPGMRVIVALSGGSDSVALTYLCRALDDAGELSLVGVAHLNHRLREEAVADVEFCTTLARTLGLPIEHGDADVASIAAQRGQSIETAAHDVRHAFLREAARRVSADRVVLGHTLDDQAETVLLRLLRGSGSRGLAGMHPRRGLFVRPLLDSRRAALQEYLQQLGAAFREDSSNADRRIPRNRIRLELLPWLSREFNPQVVSALAQQAELARDEWDWLRQSADELLRAAAHGEAPEWTVAVDRIHRAHPAVARVALRTLMEEAASGRPIGWAHVNGALELCRPETTGARDFPGQRVERRGPDVVLSKRLSVRGRGTDRIKEAPNFAYPLPIPGEARIPEAGATISAEVGPLGHLQWSDRSYCVVVRFDPDTAASWRVRSRLPGDRLTVAGLEGHKKLQDLFVDRKVPRGHRDRIPIVVNQNDRIVWVPGQAVAGEFRVTDAAQAVIILTLRLWGGSA